MVDRRPQPSPVARPQPRQRERGGHRQDDVPILAGTLTPPVVPGPRHVAGRLAVQRRQVHSISVTDGVNRG